MISTVGAVFGAQASSALRPAVGAANSAAVAPTAASAAPGAGFTAVMEQMATEAVSTVRGAEAAAISGLNGTLPVQQVVTAVMAAEQTLTTAVALRDKAVAAYQEISRMSI